MNPEVVLFEKIEAYLRGLLPPAEAEAFATQIAADPNLSALVEQQRLERQALELLVERDLRVRMNTWERDAPPAMVPVASRRWSVTLGSLRWAAAALLLLAAGWWLFQGQGPAEPPVAVQQPQTPSAKPKTPAKPTPAPRKSERTTPDPTPPDAIVRTPEQPAPTPTPKPSTPAPALRAPDYATLSNEFYRERDFFPAPSSGTSGAGYDRALRNFQDGRYTDVVPQLKPGGKLQADDLKSKELLAHAWLKNRQYDAAIATFQEIADTRKAPYAERADWALALACLRQMPQRQALLNRTLDRILAKPGHAFYSKAKALRDRL